MSHVELDFLGFILSLWFKQLAARQLLMILDLLLSSVCQTSQKFQLFTCAARPLSMFQHCTVAWTVPSLIQLSLDAFLLLCILYDMISYV